MPDGNQALGLWIGERADADAVDDGEDGGVGADANRQSKQHDRGEGRGASQSAPRVARVTADVGEPRQGTLIAQCYDADELAAVAQSPHVGPVGRCRCAGARLRPPARRGWSSSSRRSASPAAAAQRAARASGPLADASRQVAKIFPHAVVSPR